MTAIIPVSTASCPVLTAVWAATCFVTAIIPVSTASCPVLTAVWATTCFVRELIPVLTTSCPVFTVVCSTTCFVTALIPTFTVSCPVFDVVWAKTFFATVRTPERTIWSPVLDTVRLTTSFVTSRYTPVLTISCPPLFTTAAIHTPAFKASFILLTCSEEDMSVLHHRAKCSQLLVTGLYFLSPSLLLALETTVSGSKHRLCLTT